MAKKVDPREISVIPIDFAAQLEEFRNGKPIGENARIPVVHENFSWKRSFVNCWTGWPNDGKSTFFMFMALMKSVVDNWRWCVWSPEMYNNVKDHKGKMIVSASDLIDEIVFMYTGRNPYKHFEQRYGTKQMAEEAYHEAMKWVEEHFIFINPKGKTFKNLIDNFRYVYDLYEGKIDGFLVDPFKNIDHREEGNGRFDLYLDNVFSDAKEFSLETNTSLNFVAHPRNDKDPKNPDGSYKLCSQFMLAGGASWNNNMDGIFSIYRPFKHKNPTDPRVTFFNLKQRKQQLVGRCGMYDKIELDFLTNRYYFDGYCPIDGSYKEPIDTKIRRDAAAKKEQADKNENQVKKSKRILKEATKPQAPSISFSEVDVDLGEHENVNEHETLF